jgi:spore germination protein KB
MTLAEYSEMILGKWLGKAAFALFFIYVFITAVLTLRNIGDFLTTQIMQQTPIQAIHICVMLVVIMGVKLGIEPLARAAELFFPWVILLLIMLVVLLAPQVELKNMQPVLEEGLLPVLKATILTFAFPFLGTVTFLMIYPAVNQIEKAGRAVFTGMLLGGLILTLITVISISVLGPDQVARHSFPSYAIARKINIGHFIERIEAILGIIWILTIYFRLSLMHYVLVLSLAESLRLREHRFLALPLGVVIVAFSIFSVPNITYLSTFNKTTMPLLVFTIALLLLLLLLVAVLRKVNRAK